MSKLRIYELARELNRNSKEIIAIALELGLDVKNHMSTLEPDQIARVTKHIQKPRSVAKPKAAKPTKKADKAKAAKEKVTPETKKSSKQPAAKKKEAEKAVAAKKPAPQQKKEQKPRAKAGGDKKTAAESQEKPKSAPKQKVAANKHVSLKQASYTIAQLENIFKIPAAKLIKSLMSLGVMANINQALDRDTIEILAAQWDISCEFAPGNDVTATPRFDVGDQRQSQRSPVITVMGHVDHGKTSLLDAIRKANVTASEAGGITQHIGAYQVEHQGKAIVFIDTPGHEAFTAMRARGAKVTDLAILVVAADEGVLPQTVEALNHAKAAEVPIIVALNKMDKPGANPERVKQQLSQYHLVPEDWGGDTIFVEVSASTGQGLDTLLEMILLVTEMQELTAAENRLAEGTVIDAKLDKGRGSVATVLIQQGTLHVGDSVVCGTAFGKVRAMFNHRGQKMDGARPSVPVEILGLSDVPLAGEVLLATPDDKTARTLAEEYSSRMRDETMAPRGKVSLEDMFQQMGMEQEQQLNLLVKADVQGTTEALKQSLGKIDVKDVKLNMIHEGVGAVTSSDVMLASASQAIIIAFNVRPDTAALKLAEEEKVEIRQYKVIYEVIDDIKAALEGLLEPEMAEKVLGRAEVRHLFKHSRIGTIAGCYVTDGKIVNNAIGRLLRDGKVVYEGRISSLKRFKEDAKEVSSGYECGIMLENYNDIKEGDEIEAYTMVEDRQ